MTTKRKVYEIILVRPQTMKIKIKMINLFIIVIRKWKCFTAEKERRRRGKRDVGCIVSAVLPGGPKFSAAKYKRGRKKNLEDPGKSGANFFQIYQKGAVEESNIFEV
jgi:hypothetical protein